MTVGAKMIIGWRTMLDTRRKQHMIVCLLWVIGCNVVAAPVALLILGYIQSQVAIEKHMGDVATLEIIVEIPGLFVPPLIAFCPVNQRHKLFVSLLPGSGHSIDA